MGLRVAVVGFGAVGRLMVQLLEDRRFPADDIRILATSTRKETLNGKEYAIETICEEAFSDVELALFAGSEGVGGASAVYAPKAVESGAVVIDNSSTFRMDPAVPLVVPEVNFDHVGPSDRLIANPNCSTIQLVVALAPIHRAARIRRAVVASYQSVSGWGLKAMEQLRVQAGQILAGKEPEVDSSVIARQIGFNVVPHIDKFLPSGYTNEEAKIIGETKKILGDEGIRVTATAVRVPVFVGHAEAVSIETERELSPEDARELLAASPGIVVVDEPSEGRYPTPIDVAGHDEVLVGRIRRDDTVEHGLNMWIVGDNLRKGAATNAIQIAEKMMEAGWLRSRTREGTTCH